MNQKPEEKELSQGVDVNMANDETKLDTAQLKSISSQSDPSKPEIKDETVRLLIEVVSEQNRLLREQIRWNKSIKQRVIGGILTGLGTVLGATVVVSVLIYGLKRIATVEWVSPIVNKVIDDIESRGRTPVTKDGSGPSKFQPEE